GGGRASLPSPSAAGADDFPGYDYRTAADGAEAGGRQRVLCAARARYHRRAERVGGPDGAVGSGGVPAGPRQSGGGLMRQMATSQKAAETFRRTFIVATIAFFGGAGYAQQDTLQLTLAAAHKLAIQNNPQLTASRYTAEAAAQVPLEIGSVFQPTLFGSVTGVGADSGSRIAAGALNNPVIYDRLGSGLSINQLVTDFGRTSNLVQSSKLKAQSQEQATEATRAQILLSVDRAYFGALRAQSVLKVAQQTVTARQLVVDQVTALAESHLKSQLDVSFAKVNLADAKLLLAGAQNDLSARLPDLATPLGIPAHTYYTLAEEPLPDTLPDQVTPLISEAIQKRPEMSGLRLEQQAAQRFEQSERALAHPSIGVIGTAGFAPAAQQAIPGHFGAIGVNLNIPIFNGGLFKARRSEAVFRTK